MADGGVRYEDEGAVARIVLARPEASNSVDLPAARAFGAAVEKAADEAVRAVLITGEGKRFCAGGDVVSMVAAEDRPSYLQELVVELDQAFLRLSMLEKPVIAAVQGAVAGAGLALILSSDIVISARSTKFLMAYAGVGLTPDCGVSYLLPRAVGQQRALELALTGRVLTAAEALEWGLVTEVVDDGAPADRGRELASELVAGPRFAFAEAKRLLRSSWEVSREQSSKDEARTIAKAVMSEDAGALIEAFVRRS
jgi:2-(1,2-epoxy-1,2-dihydrophenyl)acetyl-CoA isomerase